MNLEPDCGVFPQPAGRGAGFTLVEVVIVIAVTALVAAVVPTSIWQSLRAGVYVPKAHLTNAIAGDILRAIIEGSESTLSGQTILGLRYAARQAAPPESALWLVEPDRLGYLVPNSQETVADNQYVVIRLDGTRITRCLVPTQACPPPGCAEEVLPYHAQAGPVAVVVSAPLFRYYTSTGLAVAPPGCAGSAGIRRVDVVFSAQTGQGEFDQGDARVEVMSSAAIRFP